jgi:LytS/YehU family sensor histidine kinase
MKARFGHRLRADVAAAHDTLDALVPSLLLQPLVENAIRHGNASHASGGTIGVRVERIGMSMQLSVTDDGPGAPAGIDVFATGIGLSATRDRLRLLYGDAHRFEAGNRGAGFVVSIMLPYRLATMASAAPEEHSASPALESGAGHVAAVR